MSHPYWEARAKELAKQAAEAETPEAKERLQHLSKSAQATSDKYVAFHRHIDKSVAKIAKIWAVEHGMDLNRVTETALYQMCAPASLYARKEKK